MQTSSRRLSVIVAACLCLLFAADAHALRIMSYNILNYSAGRTTEFRTILEQTEPDVLLVQEILSQSGVTNYLNDVLNAVSPGEWTAGPFVNGPDTDNAIYYRHDQVTYISHHVITTTLRHIDEWTIRPTSHTSAEANIRIYTVHLKASSGSTNQQRRLTEVTAMRAYMETYPAGQNYLVLGDFNIYTASEPAFQYMIGSSGGPAGIVQDPISRVGNWHVNASFADIHTQSPRTTSFGGGATGGMDDRFDMILCGPATQDGEGLDILASTYNAFGQDGLHFDTALNQPPYVVVDSMTAAAIHNASDHLPVHVDFQLPAILATEVALDLGTVIVDGLATADLAVSNGATAPADELDYSFSAPAGFSAPGGSFTREAGDPPALHAIGMTTSTVGVRSGDLTISTDDPDRSAFPVQLSGTVLDHAAPSVDPSVILLTANVNFGTVAGGDSSYVVVRTYNHDAGPLRALLEVYDFEFVGDPFFFLDDEFSPTLVGTTPAAWTVGFDAATATVGTYNATLTFATRDQQDLSGAVTLADLIYVLSATVSTSTGIALESVLPVHAGLVSISPNPFRPATEILFGLPGAGHVDLRIFDVQGRAVRTLVAGALAAGEHRLSWNGRDAVGSDLAPGIYFVRLATDRGVETRKLVRLR